MYGTRIVFMSPKGIKIYMYIAGAMALPAWLYLFWYDWRIGLCVFFILWSNNALISRPHKEGRI